MGKPYRFPACTRALDDELEIGFALACGLLDANLDAAIGGFVVLNDVSARDVQPQEMLLQCHIDDA